MEIVLPHKRSQINNPKKRKNRLHLICWKLSETIVCEEAIHWNKSKELRKKAHRKNIDRFSDRRFMSKKLRAMMKQDTVTHRKWTEASKYKPQKRRKKTQGEEILTVYYKHFTPKMRHLFFSCLLSAYKHYIIRSELEADKFKINYCVVGTDRCWTSHFIFPSLYVSLNWFWYIRRTRPTTMLHVVCFSKVVRCVCVFCAIKKQKKKK